MHNIPLIKINNKRIQDSELLDKLNDEELVYLIDLDAIERDKPNLDIYQKLSKKYQLWIDNAPRTLGDVVDVFMTGAANITLRINLYPKINLEKIREVTENQIYANIEMCYGQGDYEKFFYDVDGITSFYNREELEKDFKKYDIIKKFSAKNKLFLYENNKQNISYWDKLNPNGFLVDILNYEEFNKI